MPTDPYRALELHRGATVAEIKQAYRRLAKAHHPDTAGDAATARFLEIQAAYEMLVSPQERGRARGPGTTRPEGWQADPGRARATREAWRARTRAKRPPGDGPGAGGPTTSGRERAKEGSEAAGTAGSAGSPGGRGRGGPRGRRRATPGSTSYDEAEHDAFEPDWAGASWYGTTSGTYWTLNPREYADPRKHGPEYQARARRGSGPIDTGEPTGPASDDADAAGRAEGPSPAPPSDDAPPIRPADPRRPTAGRPGDSAAAPSAGRRPRSSNWPGEVSSARHAREAGPPPDRTVPLLRFLDEAGRSISGRIVLALAGWVPIGIVLATAMGEGTGCARYLAECQGPFGAATIIGQGAVVLLLALLPRLAAIATLGTVAMLAAALPAAAVLSISGGARDPAGATSVFVVVLVVGWTIGIAGGVGRLVRSRPDRPPVP